MMALHPGKKGHYKGFKGEASAGERGSSAPAPPWAGTMDSPWEKENVVTKSSFLASEKTNSRWKRPPVCEPWRAQCYTAKHRWQRTRVQPLRMQKGGKDKKPDGKPFSSTADTKSTEAAREEEGAHCSNTRRAPHHKVWHLHENEGILLAGIQRQPKVP